MPAVNFTDVLKAHTVNQEQKIPCGYDLCLHISSDKRCKGERKKLSVYLHDGLLR